MEQKLYISLLTMSGRKFQMLDKNSQILSVFFKFMPYEIIAENFSVVSVNFIFIHSRPLLSPIHYFLVCTLNQTSSNVTSSGKKLIISDPDIFTKADNFQKLDCKWDIFESKCRWRLQERAWAMNFSLKHILFCLSAVILLEKEDRACCL